MLNSNNNSSFVRPLIQYMEQYHKLSSSLIAQYEKHCSLVIVRKNKYIVSPVDSNAALYFVKSGIVRGFIKDGAKDITTWFCFGNNIVGAIRHPDLQANHSVEYLQALEDCELIRIPYTLIDYAYSHFEEANIIGRKLLAVHYYAASERSILARIPNALRRYQNLAESRKVDLNKIPLRYLASYLGMRLETLSRIKKKVLHKTENRGVPVSIED
ncbi:Crp/Fnr family transcriptional regulator [Pedobacter psychrodurus]|uniref:Crp/Fnr family transcriptional regulator n=1 Tax=Pedobacter psychrodurus TaxID=2530456 RepID=A0A4R0PRN3_9SPHI|nr:Crp/Fnr family transcriptional regulator [Pedobacter psychrodurus]TCD23450.1 Crp/Fnr family transcriptional regulator [Pedobacter psychrodurus]